MASAAARKKTSAGMSDKTSDIILVAICAIALIIVAYPLYYVLVASISDPYDVYAGKTFLLPSGFTLDGYKAVFADPKIVSGFLNSVKYTVIGTCFSVIMLYITAYPLADKNLPGRKWISLFFVFTMYFGGGLVPTYLVVQDTGLIGSMWSLFLPGGVGVGNMIVVRNYFQHSIPHDLVEAFHSTLEEVENADLLLHVVDYSDSHYREQAKTTRETLQKFNAGAIPAITVYNKSDKSGEETAYPRRIGEDKIYISAKDEASLRMLTEMILERVYEDYLPAEFLIPYDEGRLISYFSQKAHVLSREYVEDGIRLKVKCHKADKDKYAKYLRTQ